MMREIRMSWAGTDYVIPETKAFQIGERIEEIATLGEILGWMQAPRFFKMARCLGEMLRFAGCKVNDTEVHSALVGSLGKVADADAEAGAGTDAGSTSAPAPGPEDGYAAAVFALVALLMGDAPQDTSGQADPRGKAAAS